MIKLENLTKIYDTDGVKTIALQNIDLQINKGEFVAIVGVSGSGKTTLLNILGGMDIPTKGNYFFDDMDISHFNNKQLESFRRDKISFVFQNFALINSYSVYKNIEIPLLARNKKNRKEIIQRCMKQMNISEYADKKVSSLSGGQKQRTAIARALASNSELLLADEPTGSLDTENRDIVMDCFKKINDSGKTVIIITHDMQAASKCSRIIKISDGKILLD